MIYEISFNYDKFTPNKFSFTKRWAKMKFYVFVKIKCFKLEYMKWVNLEKKPHSYLQRYQIRWTWFTTIFTAKTFKIFDLQAFHIGKTFPNRIVHSFGFPQSSSTVIRYCWTDRFGFLRCAQQQLCVRWWSSRWQPVSEPFQWLCRRDEVRYSF